jgi:quercetin dioxygenase-like cupin family protein
MSSGPDKHACPQGELVSLYALHALASSEIRIAEAHIAGCSQCHQEMQALRPVIDSLTSWPTDLLRPPESLRERLAYRIAAETGREPVLPTAQPWSEPEWEEVAPGVSCKLLATDTERERISMLVRLKPGVDYPPHTHAGVEELHLLHGELWIDDRKLYPGDYHRKEAGTVDQRVWSETGCTCVLMTSSRDFIL